MKLDRLLGILAVLLQNESVTAPYLAKKFEVSRRTISRDIDSLCMAGIPVITRQGSGGGISIAEGFKLDKSVLTADELSHIIAALKGIGSVTSSLVTENALNKLSANKDAVVSMCEPVIIDLASYYKGNLTEKIELVKKAVRSRQLIEFDYYYEKGVDKRKIEPAYVIFQWSSWYVYGYCTLRKGFRMFKLQRLWNLKLLDETFTPHPLPPESEEKHLNFSDDKALVAVFDSSQKYKLIETYGLDCYTEMPNGSLRLEVNYANHAYMLSWLLGFGGNVKVLEPKALAQDLYMAAKKIIEAHEHDI